MAIYTTHASGMNPVCSEGGVKGALINQSSELCLRVNIRFCKRIARLDIKTCLMTYVTKHCGKGNQSQNSITQISYILIQTIFRCFNLCNILFF